MGKLRRKAKSPAVQNGQGMDYVQGNSATQGKGEMGLDGISGAHGGRS